MKKDMMSFRFQLAVASNLRGYILDPCIRCMTHLALPDSLQAADRAVIQTHLRLLGLPWGLAVNFGKRSIRYEFVLRLRNNRPADPR